MFFRFFTPGIFPDTNLTFLPVTRVLENIKKKEPLLHGSIPFHKGACLICGAVLVDRSFPQRTPDDVTLLAADRTPEPTDFSADVNQLITICFQLTSAVRTVEAIELLDRYIHNPHRHSLTLFSIQKNRLYES